MMSFKKVNAKKKFSQSLMKDKIQTMFKIITHVLILLSPSPVQVQIEW